MFSFPPRKTSPDLGYRLLAVLLVPILMFESVGLCQKPQLKADDLFQTDALLEIEIEMPENDWNALTAQTRDFGSAFQNPGEKPFTSFRGTITVNGVRIESVGIRKKGFIGSLDDVRPSLKIKFDEYVDQDPIEGLDRLTLNNNKQDYSMVSQYLTYQTFREAGLPAPRVSFARVTVNGEHLGVYSNVETVRKPFLKNAFGDASGALYEGTLADFYPKAIERLEAKTKKGTGALDKPLQLAELLAAEGELNLEEVEKMVDVPNFIKFWAIESLIGFWDGYSNNQNNYFVYDHPGNHKYYFIPWGADGAFDSGRGMFRQMPMTRVDSTAVYAQAMLANRLYWAGNIAEQYDAVMRGLLDKVWNEDALVAEVDRIGTLVAKDMHEDQSEHAGSMDQVKNFIRVRRSQIVNALAAGSASVPTTPRKPMYSVPVGHAKGTFSTVWREENNGGADAGSPVELNVVLGGETVEFTSLAAAAGPQQFRGFGPGFGGRRGRGGRGGQPNDEPPPVSITLSGVRKSDGQRLTVSLIIDRKSLIAGVGTPLTVNGSVQEGNGGGFGRPGGMRSVVGTFSPTAAGVNPGDTIAGSVDLEIVETRGGMFSRR